MIARLKAMDRRIAFALVLAAAAAVAGPFKLAVGYHSHPVGRHSHPMTVPYVGLHKYADAYWTEVRQTVGYTVTAYNHSPLQGIITELIDTLPDGFEYVPGSTSGRIVADPVVDGRKLRWRIKLTVGQGYSTLLRFEARASNKPGRYYNVVDGRIRAPGIINGSGPSAMVLVGAPTELFAQAALMKDDRLRLKFSARLTTRGKPLAGRWVDFRTTPAYVNSGCSAMTNADGVAECTGVLPLATAVASLGYEAEYNPYWWYYDYYAPSSDHGDLIE